MNDFRKPLAEFSKVERDRENILDFLSGFLLCVAFFFAFVFYARFLFLVLVY